MRTIPLEQFQAEVKAAGYRFTCPMCGHVAHPRDFVALGVPADRAGDRAARECIGRAQTPMAKYRKDRQPCDWAAFGLFGTCGKGLLVEFPDGKAVEVFQPAPVTP